MPRGIYERTAKMKANMSAAAMGHSVSKETCQKISKALTDVPKSPEHCAALSDAHTDVPLSPAHCAALSAAKMGHSVSEEARAKSSAKQSGVSSPLKGRNVSETSKRKASATKQGIIYDDWESYACEKKYCPKFNEACRESNRVKYNYRCFMCNKPQSKNIDKNNKVRKLSVHHVDMDKAQGCESNWKLVPLCMKCHSVAHNDEMIARLGYCLTN